MGRKPPKFGRKPQIQLDGTTTKQPTFGLGYQPAESSSEAGGDGKGPSQNQGSAASFSLLASYGDSDTDDDDAPQRTEPQKPPKPIAFHKQMFVKADTLEPLKGSSPAPTSGSSSPAPEPAPKQPENTEKKAEEPQKELTEDDLKLKAFLSEIDAMDPGDAPTPPAAEGCQSSESEEEEEEEKPEPAEAKPVEPVAPTTPWQHCLDEGTQHYYYWHVTTNEVTWEIPPDYSQHLLRVNEHELASAKYKRELAAWEKREECRLQREKERQERAEQKRIAKAKRAEEKAAKKKAAALEAAKAAALKEPSPPPPPASSVETADDSLSELDVDRQLEEAVEATYKTKSKPKPAVTEEKGDDTMDMDDIEKQLDMALEEKTKMKKEEKADAKPVPQKRKGSGQPNMPTKRPRQEEVAENGIVVSRLSMEDMKGKMSDMEKVVELSDILADKLQFLGATTETMSVPQVLLVQLEARLCDWRCGGLRTWRLLEMLSQSASELERYESTVSTPAGWACHWHREYKRYFYCHEVTGESQWDFPQESPDIAHLVLDPRGPPPPPPETHHPPAPSSEDHPREDDSSADMNSIYDVTLVKDGTQKDLNGADLDGVPLSNQKETEQEKLSRSKPSTASLVMDYDDSEEEDVAQTKNEDPVVQTPAVTDPQDVQGPQLPEERTAQPVAPDHQVEPVATGPTIAEQAPQAQTTILAPMIAQPPPPPPSSDAPSHPNLQNQQDLLQALSAAPPPPPPPLEPSTTVQQQQVPGVNFMDLASAPPPPPPPPANPGAPKSLEPGELADSDDEDKNAAPPVPGEPTAVPGNPAVAPGCTENAAIVAADPVLAPGYAATQVPGDASVAPGYVAAPVPGNAAAPMAPGSVEGATLDEEAPGSGAVIQAPPAPAEIEAPPVQLVAPPVLIEKTNGAAHSSPPHTSSSSSSSSSRHERKKKKKDKDKEKGLVSGKLSMKKKKVPSLVEKWQNVQKEVASKSKDSDDK